ncbi:hypothetical protein BO78DRAFT_205691 [Aspergillus sclerotiicarbonarius CBS 121057]|uniref:Uncharacterized protein n=1 Tax=Aspergillus sclerotiicarbonarius (strain CBS 121057 / IBT 28362) TaxID=1448318 RepID=A0A319EK34_ASPSB|nr:hypothetical protein BO78DRAFT_205691 [Aspergillus sclerotiicarbonarius CBS 121057]
MSTDTDSTNHQRACQSPRPSSSSPSSPSAASRPAHTGGVALAAITSRASDHPTTWVSMQAHHVSGCLRRPSSAAKFGIPRPPIAAGIQSSSRSLTAKSSLHPFGSRFFSYAPSLNYSPSSSGYRT